MKAIFDRNRLRLHRDRVAPLLHNHDFLLKFSSEDIIDRLDSLSIKTDSILELGSRTGLLTSRLIIKYPESRILATDISANMLALNPAKDKCILDEEEMQLEGGAFDIIASVLNMHWINDMRGFLSKISNGLTDDGIFIASLFGGSSLLVLRQALLLSEINAGSGHSPHISPSASSDDIYRLLQLAGFKFIVTDIQKIELEYDTAIACMQEIQNMGESSNLVDGVRPLSKAILKNLENGEFMDRVEIITLIASRGNVHIHP